MTKEQMLAAIQAARAHLDLVYYYAEGYNQREESQNPHMVEIERLMSHADSCAMDAETAVAAFFKETTND